MTGSYTIGTTLDRSYGDSVEAVRAALAEQGFGVLTEIDLAATLRAKLGVEVAPQVILGACRPQLAHEALEADPSVAALLPCNVVVRALDDGATRVEAFDPAVMMSLSDGDGAASLRDVADDARARLVAALDALAGGVTGQGS